MLNNTDILQQHAMTLRWKKLWPKLVVYGILWFIVAINLFPFFNLFLNSFRYHRAITIQPLAFDEFTKTNYIKAEEYGHLFRGLFNGVFISFCSIILLIITGTMSSYALTFIPNKATPFLHGLISLGYFVPPASIMLTVFLMYRNLRLLNTYTGIVLVYGAIFTAITMFILTGYMKSIPKSVIECAQIEGASHFRIYLWIVLPLSSPAIVTLIILLFLWTYRDYMWPLILMARPVKRTIAVALATFISDRYYDFGILSAAVIASLIPIMITYYFLKDKIMRGMAAGSVKG